MKREQCSFPNVRCFGYSDDRRRANEDCEERRCTKHERENDNFDVPAYRQQWQRQQVRRPPNIHDESSRWHHSCDYGHCQYSPERGPDAATIAHQGADDRRPDPSAGR